MNKNWFKHLIYLNIWQLVIVAYESIIVKSMLPVVFGRVVMCLSLEQEV